MRAISLCTLALVGIVFLRYLCLFELEIVQKKVYLPQKMKVGLIYGFFRYSGRVIQLSIEIFIMVLHPIDFLAGNTFKLFQTIDEVYLSHSYNDILSLLSIAKIYLVVRSFLTLTSYSSPRASRLCHQNGLEHNLIYTVKCVLH